MVQYTLTVLAAMTLERPVFKIGALDMYSHYAILSRLTMGLSALKDRGKASRHTLHVVFRSAATDITY